MRSRDRSHTMRELERRDVKLNNFVASTVLRSKTNSSNTMRNSDDAPIDGLRPRPDEDPVTAFRRSDLPEGSPVIHSFIVHPDGSVQEMKRYSNKQTADGIRAMIGFTSIRTAIAELETRATATEQLASPTTVTRALRPFVVSNSLTTFWSSCKPSAVRENYTNTPSGWHARRTPNHPPRTRSTY